MLLLFWHYNVNYQGKDKASEYTLLMQYLQSSKRLDKICNITGKKGYEEGRETAGRGRKLHFVEL